MAIKMRMKKKNRSHEYDINKPRLTHGHEYTEYKTCVKIMMVICIKQHLSNIWSSIHENVTSNTEAELKAFYKNGTLKNFPKSTEAASCRAPVCSFTNKETPAQLFPCGFYKIFKNQFLEHFWTAPFVYQ